MKSRKEIYGRNHYLNTNKRSKLRIDLTPMVDINMLLLTFFMACTTFLQLHTMGIHQSSSEAGTTKGKQFEIITVFLGEKDDVYYEIENRSLDKFPHTTKNIKQVLDQEVARNKGKRALTILIKPTKFSTYKNLVTLFDGIRSCHIEDYKIVDLTQKDRALLSLKTGNKEYLTEE